MFSKFNYSALCGPVVTSTPDKGRATYTVTARTLTEPLIAVHTDEGWNVVTPELEVAARGFETVGSAAVAAEAYMARATDDDARFWQAIADDETATTLAYAGERDYVGEVA